MADNDNWTCAVSGSLDVFNFTVSAGSANLDTTTITTTPTGILTRGIYIHTIEFFPSAANDKIVIRDVSATGAFILHPTDVLGGGLLKPYYQYLARLLAPNLYDLPTYETQNKMGAFKPYLKYADCTFGTPASIVIIIHGAPAALIDP